MKPEILNLQKLKKTLGPKGWIEDKEIIEPYLVEERGLFIGKSSLLLKPQNTEEVSKILKLCNEHNIKVVPQGGRTGLCGGTIPSENGKEIMLSLERMNNIKELNEENFTITVEAGCILNNIQNIADEKNFLFPLSLASEGSCTIGGNISTNAGGINVLRYGMARDLVLGIEVVLANGEIWNNLISLRKDNRGYDLKQLFIGSEGTLGIITSAVLKLFPAPRNIETALFAIPNPDAAIELLGLARSASADLLNAYELVSRVGMEMVIKNIPGAKEPLKEKYKWYILIEFSSSSKNNLRQQIEDLFELALNKNIVLDGVIAESTQQRKELWTLRDGLNEAQKPEGGSIKHDISVPINNVSKFIYSASKCVEEFIPNSRVVAFGHIGDGNIHFNISQPLKQDKKEFLNKWTDVNKLVFDIVKNLDGSFSAEHGIGKLKREELQNYNPTIEINLMKSIKSSFDPNNILNPGKVL
ncbi:MAG: FAD-binding oxidoreductase [Alphaproteobacteria bacterium]|jgi:D-lactate dehydrogenase (cytochrome)|nr:FAD-binding oxidoreductase [Alphaproteobacteria bacterium]